MLRHPRLRALCAGAPLPPLALADPAPPHLLLFAQCPIIQPCYWGGDRSALAQKYNIQDPIAGCCTCCYMSCGCATCLLIQELHQIKVEQASGGGGRNTVVMVAPQQQQMVMQQPQYAPQMMQQPQYGQPMQGYPQPQMQQGYPQQYPQQSY